MNPIRPSKCQEFGTGLYGVVSGSSGIQGEQDRPCYIRQVPGHHLATGLFKKCCCFELVVVQVHSVWIPWYQDSVFFHASSSFAASQYLHFTGTQLYMFDAVDLQSGVEISFLFQINLVLSKGMLK